MKLALVLALSVSYALPVHAESANSAASAEARRFLIPCNQVEADKRGYCARNQEDFLDSYVRAKAGNPEYMHDLTRFYSTWTYPNLPISRPGVRQNRQEGCTWLLVEAAFDKSPEGRRRLATEIHLACIDFTADARLAMWLRATDLVGEIRTHPAKEPPAYKPPTKGLIATVPDAN